MSPVTVAPTTDKPNHPPEVEPREDHRRNPIRERLRKAVQKDGRRRHLRHWVQIGIFAITVAVGIQFARFVHQAAHLHAITIQRPSGVEGFLPIGGLMGWKLFFTTGIWDPIHPAAMVILGFAALISWAWRKSFCAWICPVGTLSEWLWRLGRQWVGRNIRLPKRIDIALRGVKYALLGFFVWIIFQMDSQGIFAFLQSPYYKLSDVKMLNFFTRMSLFTGGVLFFLTFGSLFIRNFWCRYLCPYGALMGVLALAGPTRIRRNKGSCIDCGRCTRDCPYHLPVERKTSIRSPECSACLDCIQSCPVEGTLTLETTGLRNHGWTPAGLALAILLVFTASICTARITGHWRSRLSSDEFRHLVQRIESPRMTHPSVRGMRPVPAERQAGARRSGPRDPALD